MIKSSLTLAFVLNLSPLVPVARADEAAQPSVCQKALQTARAVGRLTADAATRAMVAVQNAQFQFLMKQIEWQDDELERRPNGLVAKLLEMSYRIQDFNRMIDHGLIRSMARLVGRPRPFYEMIEAVAVTFRDPEARRAYNSTTLGYQALVAYQARDTGVPYDYSKLEPMLASTKGSLPRIITLTASAFLFHEGERRPRWHRRGEVVRVRNQMVVASPGA